jgi:predicted nucleic acid-binding Zn ribbon protein
MELDDDDIDNDELEHEDDGEWTCDRCGGPMYRQFHLGYARCDDCGKRQELINDDYI